jgi:hypothetical protein
MGEETSWVNRNNVSHMPRQADLYNYPTYSKHTGQLFFLASYEMYVMDWKKREATMIIRDNNMIES